MKRALSLLVGLLLVAGVTLGAPAPASAQKEIVIGLQCDRTGATQLVGVNLCPGYHDYINLVNSKGGVEGHKIKRRSRSITSTRCRRRSRPTSGTRRKARCSIRLYGTPQTQALTKKLTEDKIPGTSPGFGTAAAANGTHYPYLFPIAATYWSQAAGAVQFIKDKLGGSLAGKKIAYLYFDNPAGHEPMVILDTSRTGEIRAQGVRGAAPRRRDGRAGARHRPALQARLRDHASVRALAVGRHQGAQGRRLSRCRR